MDLFTHAFIPYIIAKIAGRSERDSRIFGFGGTVPDFDSLFMWVPFLIPPAYAFTHRGITHSFLFALPFSAILLYFFSRGKVKRFMARFVTLDFDFSARSLGIVYAGSLSHIFLDWLTTGGLPLFYPFSEVRYSAYIFFYVDIILMIFSTFAVIAFLTKRLSVRQKHVVLYTLLFLFLTLGATRLSLKASMTDKNMSTYPTTNISEWMVVQKGKDAFTVFQYNPTTKEGGQSHLFPYTDKAKIQDLLDKANTIPNVRQFEFHATDVEVFAQRVDSAWTLSFFDPTQGTFMRNAPSYIRHHFIEIMVKIYDDGTIELIDG
jgi:inner membrane protein